MTLLFDYHFHDGSIAIQPTPEEIDSGRIVGEIYFKTVIDSQRLLWIGLPDHPAVYIVDGQMDQAHIFKVNQDI